MDREAPEDIKWHKIVKNLREAGLSHLEIGMATGFTSGELMQMESKIYEPPYLAMIKLLDLHITVCPTRHLTVGIHSPEEV